MVRRLVLRVTLETKGSSGCMVGYLGLPRILFVLSYTVTTQWMVNAWPCQG